VPGKKVFIVTYACRLEGSYVPKLSPEHKEIGLFAADALPQPLPPGYRASIAARTKAEPVSTLGSGSYVDTNAAVSTAGPVSTSEPDPKVDTGSAVSRHLAAEAYNNGWANHRLLRACTQLSQGEFAARRTGFFPSIRATLNHILTVDWFYIDALEREARGAPPHPDFRSAFFSVREPFDSCAPLWEAQRAADRRLVAYCKALRDRDLQRVVSIDRGDGLWQRDTRQRLLAHLFEHQIHHRGQVHAMLSGTSVAPPQLDEFFPAGEAPLRAADFAELGWTEEDIWGPNLS
jgi:uncharacterized damage-inducible protein DinB